MPLSHLICLCIHDFLKSGSNKVCTMIWLKSLSKCSHSHWVLLKEPRQVTWNGGQLSNRKSQENQAPAPCVFYPAYTYIILNNIPCICVHTCVCACISLCQAWCSLLHILSPFTLWGACQYHSSFVDEEGLQGGQLTCTKLLASKWRSWDRNSGYVAPQPKFLAAALHLCFMYLSRWAVKCLTQTCYYLSHKALRSCREGGNQSLCNSKPGLSDCIHVVQGELVFGTVHCISSAGPTLAFLRESTSFTVGSSSPLNCRPLVFLPSLAYPQWSFLLALYFICFSTLSLFCLLPTPASKLTPTLRW